MHEWGGWVRNRRPLRPVGTLNTPHRAIESKGGSQAPLSSFTLTSRPSPLFSSSVALTDVGTPQLKAPEILEGGAYDPLKADIYSCGVLLFLILYGAYYKYSPLKDEEGNSWRKQVPAWGAAVSPACAALLDSMLRPRPADRISAADIVLKDPWIRSRAPSGWLEGAGVPGPAPGMQSEEEVRALVAEARALPRESKAAIPVGPTGRAESSESVF